MPIKPHYQDMTTEQRVIAAGLAVLAGGQRPSTQSILQELGGSSASTVNQHMPALWEYLGTAGQSIEPLVDGLPGSLKEDFRQALEHLFLTTRDIAEKAASARYADLESKVGELEHQVNDKTAECGELSRANESLTADLSKSDNRIRELSLRISTLDESLLEAKSESAKKDGEISSLRQRLSDSADQLHEIKETSNQRISSLQQQISNDADRIESLRTALEGAQDRIRQLEHNIELERSENTQALEHSRSDLSAAQDQIANLQRQLNDVTDEKNSMSENLWGQLKECQRLYDEVRRQHQQLLQRNTSLERENAEMASQLSAEMRLRNNRDD